MSLNITRDKHGLWAGGVFCGKEIAPKLYAEEVANRRYVIRTADTHIARRLGEVMGGDGRFQACTMKGDHVGVEKSLLTAANLLL